MQKRQFLSALGAGAAGGLALAHPAHAATASEGPPLLSVTGAIAKTNRGPFDPALDQMMEKHGAGFKRAFVLTAASLQQLPAVTIQPTLEYDGKVHTLRGPLLVDVLAAAGADTGRQVQLTLRAVDGYNVNLSLAEATANRMLVATHIDGQPMALGGLGPQWAVWDADRLPHLKNKPLKDRFGQCPWGLYMVDVSKG